MRPCKSQQHGRSTKTAGSRLEYLNQIFCFTVPSSKRKACFIVALGTPEGGEEETKKPSGQPTRCTVNMINTVFHLLTEQSLFPKTDRSTM